MDRRSENKYDPLVYVEGRNFYDNHEDLGLAGPGSLVVLPTVKGELQNGKVRGKSLRWGQKKDFGVDRKSKKYKVVGMDGSLLC